MTKSTPRKSAASTTPKDSDTTDAAQQGEGAAKPGEGAPGAEQGTEQGTEQTGDQTEQGTSDGGEQVPSGNSGPGTGVEAPEESTPRPPATMLDLGSTESGPLDPPGDARQQIQPEKGYNESSTDHVYAATGGRTIAGEDHLRLVDEDDNELGADDLFDDDPKRTWVTAKVRVYEVFQYPHTTEEAKRLLFAAGRRVPREQAEKIKAEINSAPEPASAAG